VWWQLVIAVGTGLALLWLALLVALWLVTPDEMGLRDGLRILPDLVRLLRRLAADSALPRGVRIRLVVLLGYLALPIDLVPDFVPVLGYADDTIVVALALRSVVRRAGPDALARHWPGSTDGLRAVHRLAGLPPPAGGSRS
jgi:uncharacterized membrane protein YkvA (DUF1232 family)